MNRKIQRILFYFLKFFISLTIHINSRLYMRFYNRLLKYFGIKIKGTPRFIAPNVRFDDFNKITLGDRLVVSNNVYFLTHDYSFTTSLIAIGKTPKSDIGIIREIEIGDNVFIGMNSIILPGCKIGNNVIIGAGSIAKGEIPNDTIFAGNPAKMIGQIQDYAIKVQERKNQELRIDKK